MYSLLVPLETTPGCDPLALLSNEKKVEAVFVCILGCCPYHCMITSLIEGVMLCDSTHSETEMK